MSSQCQGGELSQMDGLAATLKRCRLMTFDCYGTLIDWEGGIRRALADQLKSADVAWDEHFFDQYLKCEARHESNPYQPYKEILSAVEAEVLGAAGVESLPEPRLAASVGQWKPFGDTIEALKSLKQRFQLGILSNIDRDSFEQTARHLQVPFDVLVTAEDVRSYKPGRAHFLRMLELTGLEKTQVLHVAQSLYHDITPCIQLGIPCVWINRRKEPCSGSVSPLAEFPDLASFTKAVL